MALSTSCAKGSNGIYETVSIVAYQLERVRIVIPLENSGCVYFNVIGYKITETIARLQSVLT